MSPRTLVSIALALALVVVSGDSAYGFLQPDVPVSHSLLLLRPALIGAVGAAVLFLTVWFLLTPIRSRLTSGLEAALVLGSASWLAAAALMPLGTTLLGGSLAGLSFPRLLLVASPIGFLCGALAARGSCEATVRSISLAAGLGALLSGGLIWTLVFSLGFGTLGQACILALFGLGFAGLVVTAWRSRALVLPGLSAALLGVALIGIGASRPPDHDGDRPTPVSGGHPVKRVLLVVVDTLRADHLSCYGSEAVSTPGIDRLADDSTLFEQARSPSSWTLPAMASIFSGVAPEVHGCTAVSAAVPARLPNLAVALREAGFRTAAIGTSIALRPWSGLNRGFDEHRFHPLLETRTPLGSSVKAFLGHEQPQPADARELTDQALEWMESHADEDFFLWLHYFDPHAPYDPPPEHRPKAGPSSPAGGKAWDLKADPRTQAGMNAEQREIVRGYYAGEVAFLDGQLARLFDRLRELGLYEDTLIVLTSDHGEEFWDHDHVSHGHTLFDELVRVPLIVKSPRPAPPRRVTESVSTISIAPFLLQACGVDATAAGFLGDPLMRLDDEGPGVAAGGPVFSSGLLFERKRVAVVVDGFKHIRYLVSGREETYDLARDPAEQRPLRLDEPGLRIEWRSLIDSFEAENRARRAELGLEGPTRSFLDVETLRALDELGYVE